MDNKTISQILELRGKDLYDFVEKSGYSDIVQFLESNKIIDGNQFLNLNELQIVLWKQIPLTTKRKIVKFVENVKNSPHLFSSLIEKKQKAVRLNKCQSESFINDNFKKELEMKFQNPSSPRQNVATKNKPLPPLPPEDEIDQEPLDEYIDMDADTIKNTPEIYPEGEYDVNGYLLPTETRRDFTFQSPNMSNPISQRPQFALPRKNSNEDYIGPEDLDEHFNDVPPPKFPEVHKKKTVFEYERTEEVYEPVDYYEPDKSPELNKSFNLSESFEIGTSLRNRPLPPLPNRKLIDYTQDSNSSFPKINNVPKKNNAITKSNISLMNFNKSLHPTKITKQVKSKSENDLTSDKHNQVYGNIDEVGTEGGKTDLIYGNTENNGAIKKTENYEMYLPDSLSTTQSVNCLPLPPKNMPQMVPTNIYESSSGEEEEEYNACLFNLNNEPFYRHTDRKGAKLLLQDLEDGAFLFRKSSRYFVTLCVKYENNYHNLGIEKSPNNKIRLNVEDGCISPEFSSFSEFVDYFSKECLTFRFKDRTVGCYLKPVLPSNKF